MTLLTRLGGHLVQGHVDGVGEVRDVRESGRTAAEVTFGLPDGTARYVVEKGSIAVDGVSLTVAGVGDDWFGVALIPHTLEVTTLGELRPGDRVNLEVDLMAKYVERSDGEARMSAEEDQRLDQAGPRSSTGSRTRSRTSGRASWSSSSTTRTGRTRATSSWPPTACRPRPSRSWSGTRQRRDLHAGDRRAPGRAAAPADGRARERPAAHGVHRVRRRAGREPPPASPPPTARRRSAR